MCDILRENLSIYYPEIQSSIERSSFIGIDCEFTGLTSANEDYNSLFDDVSERYKKLKEMAQKFTICQLGISAFVKVPNENRYKCYTYNFYLFPPWHKMIDSRFSCQASSIQFLCHHGFDFNKWFYHGISYLTLKEEKLLRDQLSQSPTSLSKGVEQFLVRDVSRKIGNWLTEGNQDKVVLGKFTELDSCQLQLALRQSFPFLYIKVDSNGELIASKVEDGELIDTDQEIAESSYREGFYAVLDFLLAFFSHLRAINYLCGFSKVFKLLIECKKPIIAHNCLTDFLLMYENFHQPLPNSLSEFKECLHQLFPLIIDTKHVVRAGRKIFEKYGLDIQGTVLDQLFSLFNSSHVKQLALYSPGICFAHDSKYDSEEPLHEAGYDAYIAGVVFLRICHFLAAKEIGSAGLSLLTFSDYMAAVQPFANCLNLIRANISCVNLAGNDPVSKLPGWLHVEGRYALNVEELASIYGAYSSVDVKLLSKRCALLAVGSFSAQREILMDSRNHKELKISKYNFWRHNQTVHFGLWGALVLTGSICLWAFMRRLPGNPK